MTASAEPRYRLSTLSKAPESEYSLEKGKGNTTLHR